MGLETVIQVQPALSDEFQPRLGHGEASMIGARSCGKIRHVRPAPDHARGTTSQGQQSPRNSKPGSQHRAVGTHWLRSLVRSCRRELESAVGCRVEDPWEHNVADFADSDLSITSLLMASCDLCKLNAVESPGRENSIRALPLECTDNEHESRGPCRGPLARLFYLSSILIPRVHSDGYRRGSQR